MAVDFPDWGVSGTLNTSINTLDADIKALTAGFGTGTSLLSVAGTIITLGGPVIVVAAVAAKAHYLVSAVLSWWSNSGAQLRGYVRLGVSLNNAGSYYNAVLTPEVPSMPINFGSGVPSSAVNQPIYALGTAFAGAPNTTDTQLAVSLVYYTK